LASFRFGPLPADLERIPGGGMRMRHFRELTKWSRVIGYTRTFRVFFLLIAFPVSAGLLQACTGSKSLLAWLGDQAPAAHAYDSMEECYYCWQNGKECYFQPPTTYFCCNPNTENCTGGGEQVITSGGGGGGGGGDGTGSGLSATRRAEIVNKIMSVCKDYGNFLSPDSTGRLNMYLDAYATVMEKLKQPDCAWYLGGNPRNRSTYDPDRDPAVVLEGIRARGHVYFLSEPYRRDRIAEAPENAGRDGYIRLFGSYFGQSLPNVPCTAELSSCSDAGLLEAERLINSGSAGCLPSVTTASERALTVAHEVSHLTKTGRHTDELTTTQRLDRQISRFCKF
jgi:hypothetical protein